MTSGIHKKILVCLRGGGGAHTREAVTLQDTCMHFIKKDNNPGNRFHENTLSD